MDNSEETSTGHYGSVCIPPRMLLKELRVEGTLDTDDLTPPTGKRLVVYGFMASMLVSSALTSTLRGTVTFGVNHTSDSSKIIASFRTVAKDSIPCACLSNLNIVGEVDEVVRLTNITYSVGAVITRAIIYHSVI